MLYPVCIILLRKTTKDGIKHTLFFLKIFYDTVLQVYPKKKVYGMTYLRSKTTQVRHTVHFFFGSMD
jgi:hypothetical protein